MNKIVIDREKERNHAISAIRFISTILIIICHVFQYLNNDLCCWFNVGVPLFFMISGFLYGGKNIQNTIFFLSRSFLKILIPYWLMLSFAIGFLAIYSPSSLNIKEVCLAFFGLCTLKGLRHLWFIPYILFCYLLIPYLQALKNYCKSKSLMKTIFVYSLFLLLIQIIGFVYKSFFLPDRITAFLIAYFIPDLYNRFNSKKTSFVVFIVVAIGFIAWGVRYYLRYNYVGPYFQIVGLYDRYSMLAAALALFLLMSFVFKNIKGSSFLSITDKLSYPVYLTHGLLIFGPIPVLAITSKMPVNIVLLCAVVLVLAWILEWISRKILAKCI